MKTAIIFLSGTLLILAGCQSQSSQSNAPATPKWKGQPYRLALGAQPAKPNPAGVTLPDIKFTANPDDLESRADLVVQVDTTGVKRAEQQPDMMIMAPTDISGADGTLSADYVSLTDKQLAGMLAGYCMNGKVKLSVALARSSLNMTSTDDQINAKRLSDWLPAEVVFKNPHPKC